MRNSKTINWVIVDLVAQKSFTAADLGGISAILGISRKKASSLIRKHGKFIHTERFIISGETYHLKSRRGGAFYFPNSK